MSDGIAAAGAAATLLAVIVALFQDHIRRWFWTPKLSVEKDVSCFPVYTGPGQPYMPHAYLRLKVHVQQRRTSAKQVQAQLLSCKPHVSVGGTADVSLENALISLPWSFDRKEFVDIPSGASRYFDIAQMRLDGVNTARLMTVTAREQYARFHLPTSDVPYTAQVLLSGENIKPLVYTISFRILDSWDGTHKHRDDAIYVTAFNRTRIAN